MYDECLEFIVEKVTLLREINRIGPSFVTFKIPHYELLAAISITPPPSSIARCAKHLKVTMQIFCTSTKLKI